MARPRRTGKPSTKATPEIKDSAENPRSAVQSEVTQGTTTNHSSTNGGTKMAGLTPEQIQALLGSTRTKGVYIARLNEFLESGEGGVCAHEEWPEFGSKAAATVKQGFENAKNGKNAADGADNVKVITNEDKVYLINLAAAGQATA